MIGLRIGPRMGVGIGPRVGVGGSSSWSVDPTSGIAVPSNVSEWNTLIARAPVTLGISAPANLYLCQEISGNLVDEISGVTLTAAGTPSYQNAITGWTRKALGTADGVAGRWTSAAAGPNPATGNVAGLLYMRIDNATAERGSFSLNGTAGDLLNININAAGTLRAYMDSAITNGVTVYEAGGVFPVLIVYDRTNSRSRVFTLTEVISPAYGAIVANGSKEIGSAAPSTARYLYSAWFTGASAAWLSTTANAKAFLQSLNWVVTGY